MSEIELYDIITLEDDTEYTVISQLEYQEKLYYLLVPIDAEENPNMNEARIVEYKKSENEVEEVSDELEPILASKFLKLLGEKVSNNEE